MFYAWRIRNKIAMDVLRMTNPQQIRHFHDKLRKKLNNDCFAHISAPFFRCSFEKEGPKMYFYLKKVKSFRIFAEQSSGRAESNNVAPVSWIQKGKNAEGV